MDSVSPRLIDRFRRLPRRSDETWQGGLFPVAAWLDDGPDGRPYRPWSAVWVSLRTGLVNAKLEPAPGAHDWTLVLAALVEFGLNRRVAGYRPARLEVADEALAASLLRALGDPELGYTVSAELGEARRVVAMMSEHLRGGPAPPDALDVPGVTVARMQAFAVAAARLYAAAPWQRLSDEDLIHVEAPAPAAGLGHFCVMGAGGQTFGLAFFPSPQDFEVLQDARTPDAFVGAEGRWSVLFGPRDELPFGDLDLWEQHGWPVAGEAAYPLAVWFGPRGEVQRPDAAALADLEGLLLALAETTEAEIDGGRWSREVVTHEGPRRVTLSVPALLEPLDAPVTPRGGGPPDRRVMERLLVEAERYVARSGFRTPEEAEAAVQRVFSGPAGAIPSTGQTPLERAQDLVFRAFEARGRRRRQLARRALELSPDCADAYVILGEAAPDVEQARALYAEGVAAGERALGPAAFAEHAGAFWDVLRTRPYMRARFGLAQSLEGLGRLDEAIGHYQELLRLNPNDNQGARYVLLSALLRTGRDGEAGALLGQFEDDPAAIWRYGRALFAFRRDGDAPAARERLREALRANRRVAKYLEGRAEVPDELPALYGLGSEEEAMICAYELEGAWRATPGAGAWLAAAARPSRKRGRR